jgi:hypothetical protein
VRQFIIKICILTLIASIGYLPLISAVHTSVSGGAGESLLLLAADEAKEPSGDQGEEKKDEVPGIDRIAASVCYG